MDKRIRGSQDPGVGRSRHSVLEKHGNLGMLHGYTIGALAICAYIATVAGSLWNLVIRTSKAGTRNQRIGERSANQKWRRQQRSGNFWR